jgi:hypothetical protein
MQKVILNSILAVLIIVPALAARERRSDRALRNAIVWTVGGIFTYVLLLVFVLPRFVQ